MLGPRWCRCGRLVTCSVSHAQMIPIMDMVVADKFKAQYPMQYEAMEGRIQVRLFNLTKVHRMRDLNPEDIDQLVAIRGMVTRTSGIVPEMRQAYFRCTNCRNTETVDVDRGHIAEPAVCSNCREMHSFEIIHNLSLYDDRQTVKMQETPESIPEVCVLGGAVVCDVASSCSYRLLNASVRVFVPAGRDTPHRHTCHTLEAGGRGAPW